MRQISSIIDRVRSKGGLIEDHEDRSGAIFWLPSPTMKRTRLLVIVSVTHGWDHVSVSTKNRVPSWCEMDSVNQLCFHDDEATFQLHPPRSDKINQFEHCLHIWRSQSEDVPRPPAWMVGSVPTPGGR